MLTCWLVAPAQTSKKDDGSKPAVDAWMQEPTPPSARNEVTPELRAARDRFWDACSMSDRPLTSPGSGRVSGGSYDMTWDPYEISIRTPNRVVLTATLMNHRSVLTTSEYSLYTEVILRVDKVYDDQSGRKAPIAGHDVTMILYGGSVRMQDGTAFTIKPASHPPDFIEPGHKYLLVLGYQKDGDFFEYGDSWDMTTGILRATSSRDLYFAGGGQMHTHPLLNGIPVELMDDAVSRALAQSPKSN
jgi:hypothetical protein